MPTEPLPPLLEPQVWAELESDYTNFLEVIQGGSGQGGWWLSLPGGLCPEGHGTGPLLPANLSVHLLPPEQDHQLL